LLDIIVIIYKFYSKIKKNQEKGKEGDFFSRKSFKN